MSLRRPIFAAGALFALLIGMPLVGQAQTGTVSGTVTDQATGAVLANARITLVGTTRFATTNQAGEYQLTGVPAGPAQVRIAVIGYQSQTATMNVQPGQTATLDFSLPQAVFTLDAVVVTAVGEQSSREVANAIGQINVEKVQEAAPNVSITEVLQGRTPGVTVLQSSGTTGTGHQIKVRGNSSINLSNTPIFIVDGARVDNDNTEADIVGGQTSSRLNDINPEDIERIEVVKGPSASTLYGTEAAAGVIQIFTKRGRRGAPEFNFKTDFGANFKSPHEFAPSVWEPQVGPFAGFFPGQDTVYAMNLLEQADANGNYGSPFSSGFIQTYGGSIRGGTDDMTYYVSGEFQDEEGTLPNNQFTRYYARGNFNITPNPVWDLQLSGGYTSNFLTLPDNDNNGFGYLGVAQISFPWDNAIMAADPGVPGSSPILTCPLAVEVTRTFGGTLASNNDNCNPAGGGLGGRLFSDIATLVNSQDVERFTGSATFRLRPTNFWSNRLTLGYDLVDQRTGFLTPVNPNRPFGSSSDGRRGLDNQTNRNLSVDYSGSLNFQFGDIGTVSSFGYQYYRTAQEITGCEGDDFTSGATTCTRSVVTRGDEDFIETKTLGVYFQEQISWRDRLFVTPAVRFDDNSAFGENFSTQVYPKVGVSAIAFDEPVGPVDQLKLRASWGRSGKQPPTTAALLLFSQRGFSVFQDDVLGVAPLQPGNLDLKPELGEEWEVGFDVGMLQNRIGLEATYYFQKTKDVLVRRPLAPSIGFPDPVWTNIGRMDNKGLELGLNVAAITNPNFRWDWTINFSTNDNQIKQLENPIIYGLGGSSQRHQEGYAFGSYFTERIIIGANGDPEVEDVPTALDLVDGVEDEHQFLGQPTPKWEGSITSSINLFRYLTLYAFLDFKGGHQLFNSTEEFRCGFFDICPEVHQRDANGDLTDRARISDFAAAIGSEGPWIEDADFMKLRTVSLRFSFPDMWARAMRVKRVSLTFAGYNLKTWTGYTGADPEINFDGQNESIRAEFLTLPTQRRFLTTLSVTF